MLPKDSSTLGSVYGNITLNKYTVKNTKFQQKITFTQQNLHHFLPTVHQNRTERSGRGVASCREINAHIETFTPTYTYIVRRPTEGTKAWPTDYRDMCYTYNRDILYVFITLYVVYGLS